MLSLLNLSMARDSSRMSASRMTSQASEAETGANNSVSASGHLREISLRGLNVIARLGSCNITSHLEGIGLEGRTLGVRGVPCFKPSSTTFLYWYQSI